MYLPIWSSFQIFHYHVLPLTEAMFLSFPSHPKQHWDRWSSKIPVLWPIFISIHVALLVLRNAWICNQIQSHDSYEVVWVGYLKWLGRRLSLCFVCLFLFGAASQILLVLFAGLYSQAQLLSVGFQVKSVWYSKCTGLSCIAEVKSWNVLWNYDR